MAKCHDHEIVRDQGPWKLFEGCTMETETGFGVVTGLQV